MTRITICRGLIITVLFFVVPALIAQDGARSGAAKVAVQAKLSHDAVHAGTKCAATLMVTIAEGWHINSAVPADDALIGTSVVIDTKGVLDSSAVHFPPGVEQEFGYAEVPLEVYEGSIAIPLTLYVAAGLKPGEYRVPVRFEYQACSDNICLAPATLSVEIPLHVIPPSQPVKRVNVHQSDELK